MKDFSEMTAQELRDYAGPVYTAQCVFYNPDTGSNVPVDYEAPTPALLDGHIRGCLARRGWRLLSMSKTMRLQAPKPDPILCDIPH